MTEQIQLFGVPIDSVRLSEAADRLLGWLDEEAPCRFVVTPNVDHVVMLSEREDLQAAYRKAAMILADGWPVVWASRLLGRPLPERVTGSDLTPALLAAADKQRRGAKVFLLGAGPGVAEQAKANIQQRWPSLRVSGFYSPPLGFEKHDDENSRIVSMINAAAPDILVIGLGAPKQELWIARHAERLNAKVALCVGATIDFLAGHKSRAPEWMQSSGLEWLHRVSTEPRRLLSRYAKDAWRFPQLVWSEWRSPAVGS